jgi:hypothetical protein
MQLATSTTPIQQTGYQLDAKRVQLAHLYNEAAKLPVGARDADRDYRIAMTIEVERLDREFKALLVLEGNDPKPAA